jgi:phosphate:Na+ symporter
MFEHYQFLQTQLRYFYEQVSTFFAHAEKQQNCYDDLLQLMNQIQKDYDLSMQQIYKKSGNGTLNNLEISTLLNISREIYSSNKAIIYAFKAFFLNPILAEKFENIPAAVK